MREAELREELKKVDDTINRAYWAFTRQANAKPPCLVVPDAYARRKEIQAELRELARKRRENAEDAEEAEAPA